MLPRRPSVFRHRASENRSQVGGDLPWPRIRGEAKICEEHCPPIQRTMQ